MATPNYGWTLPTPGASENVWGSLLNAIFESLDSKSPARVKAGPLASRPATPESLHDVYIAVDTRQIAAAEASGEGFVWRDVAGSPGSYVAIYACDASPGDRVVDFRRTPRQLFLSFFGNTDESGAITINLNEFPTEGGPWSTVYRIQDVYGVARRITGAPVFIAEATQDAPNNSFVIEIVDADGEPVTETLVFGELIWHFVGPS